MIVQLPVALEGCGLLVRMIEVDPLNERELARATDQLRSADGEVGIVRDVARRFPSELARCVHPFGTQRRRELQYEDARLARRIFTRQFLRRYAADAFACIDDR